jgi:hypothetical protein
LLVNLRGLSSAWGSYETYVRPPTIGDLATAIAGLAKPETLTLTDGTGARCRYRIISREHLIAWAEDSGFATAEQLDEALRRETPTRRAAR